MSPSTEHEPELDALLGAYVLDALDPDERARIDDYLTRNPRARAEVDDLRETTAVLAAAPLDDDAASDDLWTRIAAEVSADPDVAPVDELAQRRASRRSRATWIASAVAASAAVVALVLAVQVVALNDDLDDAQDPSSENVAAEFDRAMEMDGAREAALTSGDNVMARVVVLPDGTGYLVNDALAPLQEDQAYQLWAVVGDESEPRLISAGVLGPDPAGSSFMIDGPVNAFAMTVEEAGGVEQSEQEPYAAGALA